ncbi:hypothetical protein D4764_16G0002040 [Takifugu flavidus]|uniref:Uncharacterized protein n=1 Tax=Takifugu flavidus TaxID=433684 RepID=A0A5C6P0W0_9TELE|nr:hypothetical protein D4764_16G0002040 [Takifugu flavidus]
MPGGSWGSDSSSSGVKEGKTTLKRGEKGESKGKNDRKDNVKQIRQKRVTPSTLVDRPTDSNDRQMGFGGAWTERVIEKQDSGDAFSVIVTPQLYSKISGHSFTTRNTIQLKPPNKFTARMLSQSLMEDTQTPPPVCASQSLNQAKPVCKEAPWREAFGALLSFLLLALAFPQPCSYSISAAVGEETRLSVHPFICPHIKAERRCLLMSISSDFKGSQLYMGLNRVTPSSTWARSEHLGVRYLAQGPPSCCPAPRPSEELPNEIGVSWLKALRLFAAFGMFVNPSRGQEVEIANSSFVH